MALLLSIETSSPICSVALHQNGQLIAFNESATPQSTASRLAVMIDEVLKNGDCQPKQLQAVVISAGPGSYTGLRIGVATAKGICYALSIPLISVNTLELMAYQIKMKSSDIINSSPSFLENGLEINPSPSLLERGLGGEVLCPMLDARRMEVYCLLMDLNLKLIEPTTAKIIDEKSFEEWLNKSPIYFFGSGADKCKEVITHVNAHFIWGVSPSSSQLGELGESKWKNSTFDDIATFEPLYLKDFMIKKPNSV